MEQNLCRLNSSAANKEGVVDLKAICDMGWQRKGSGRAYNNKSGHGVLIGTESEKILSYRTRISNCKQYVVNKVTGRVKEHDLRMNWGVSSKAMGSGLAVDMLVSGTTEKARISTIIMDKDSTAMAKIKKSVPHEVTKESPIFEKHTKNADALSPNECICANESLNLVVASKAPKMHHYSKSEKIDFRIASAVCQKSIDQTYMTDVSTTISLSQGKISHKFSLQQEKIKLKKKQKSSSVQFIKRRLPLKESRRSSGSQQQLREGLTYESSVGLENISVNNTTTIPLPTCLPESDIIKDIENCTVSFLDLETTGL